MPIESLTPSNHLILCCSLLLLPSIFPSIRVFSNELALCIRWPKYWSFSFSISPSNIQGIFTSPGSPTVCQTQSIESLWLHTPKLTFYQRKEREWARKQMRKAAPSSEETTEAKGWCALTTGRWGPFREDQVGRPPGAGSVRSGTAGTFLTGEFPKQVHVSILEKPLQSSKGGVMRILHKSPLRHGCSPGLAWGCSVGQSPDRNWTPKTSWQKELLPQFAGYSLSLRLKRSWGSGASLEGEIPF